MKEIVELAEKLGYNKFHPQWFENNKLQPETELLEMVLLQKWIRENYHIDIIIKSEYIGYGYLLYHRFPPKNTLNINVYQYYEEALKDGVRDALKQIKNE